LAGVIEAVLQTQPSAHWLAALDAAGVPCGPLNNIGQALANPQVRSRHMVVETALPDGTPLIAAGNPIKLSAHADPATRDARVENALAIVGLKHAAEKKVHAYSLGMKQRLGIANALLQPRKLLILDEPTNGLDPQGTREVRTLIRSLSAQGITIFISSHLLIEIEQICTHLAVMSAGKIVAQGSLEDLSHSEILNLEIQTLDSDKAIATLNSLDIEARSENNRIRANIAAGFLPANAIVEALVKAGVRVEGFSLAAPTLEERFVSLTGEGFDVAG
jgi:ABC-2 type transport system ATP-binding protein